MTALIFYFIKDLKCKCTLCLQLFMNLSLKFLGSSCAGGVTVDCDSELFKLHLLSNFLLTVLAVCQYSLPHSKQH